MLRYWVVAALAIQAPTYGDQVIWLGEMLSFAGPVYPFDPNEGYEITIGYGAESNTLGDGLWRTQPGFYDLSGDPDLDGFLTQAANGQGDEITITITDGEGHQSAPGYPPDTEYFIYARYGFADLFPLEVTGVRLNLLSFYPPGVGGTSGVTVRWEFLGIPEPATGLMLSVTGLLLLRRGRR